MIAAAGAVGVAEGGVDELPSRSPGPGSSGWTARNDRPQIPSRTSANAQPSDAAVVVLGRPAAAGVGEQEALEALGPEELGPAGVELGGRGRASGPTSRAGSMSSGCNGRIRTRPSTLGRLMAVPKQKQSHARTNKRRSQHKAAAPTLNACPTCHSPRRPHRVCPVCGSYAGP